MKKISSQAEYEQLCEEIWHHNRLYFQEAAPEISDELYDEQMLLLIQTEHNHPEWISSTSPTQRVGELPIEGFSDVEHALPMLSLEKAFTEKELHDFYERVCRLVDRKDVQFFADLKVDGLAISVVYEKGRFVRAVTRGDGRVGSDISHNVRTMPSIPLRIPNEADLLEIRGEVFLPNDAFMALNQQRLEAGLPLWANPRNAAAGSLKLLSAKETAARGGLSCVMYGIAQQVPRCVALQHEVIDFLHTQGFPTWKSMGLTGVSQLVCSVEEMMIFQSRVAQLRHTLPFGIDGVVFKLDNLEESESIAPTIKHPRTAIAWKFGAERVWTVVKEIVVQVGRTGVITPVAELEPVHISGSVVRRATLHNEQEIERKDIRPLDRVLIEKGGDIIPKIIDYDKSQVVRSEPWVMPEFCPCCTTRLVRGEEVAWYCPNHEGCSEQRIRGILFFAGIDGLKIDHVGEKLIRALFEAGYITSASDLFMLTKEKLLSLDGIKEKSANNILEGIAAAKHVPLDVFITALAIRHVGRGTSARLAQCAGTIEKFLLLTKEDLLSIEGIGEQVADTLVCALQDGALREKIHTLLHVGIRPEPCIVYKGIDGHPLQNAVVVLTGTLQSMTRSEATARIEHVGGKVVDTVTKKTTVVVVGQDPGSKLVKAQKLHVRILSEEEFIQLLGQYRSD